MQKRNTTTEHNPGLLEVAGFFVSNSLKAPIC